MKDFRIIQASPTGTASTVLANALYGMLDPKSPVVTSAGYAIRNSLITKCHDIDIDRWNRVWSDRVDLLFVCSERQEIPAEYEDTKNGKIQHWGTIDDKYRSYDNVVVFGYEELLETEYNSISDIIDVIVDRIRPVLPEGYDIHRKEAISRIEEMNSEYEKIQDKPFEFFNPFFHIHGSHRGRSGK